MKHDDALLVKSVADGRQEAAISVAAVDVMASSAILPEGFIEELNAVRGPSLREIAAGWTTRIRSARPRRRRAGSGTAFSTDLWPFRALLAAARA